MAQDRDLLLELPDPLASGLQLCVLRRRDPGPLATVDAVLTDPVVDTGGAQAEFVSDLSLWLAGAHKRDSPRTDLECVEMKRTQVREASW